MPKSQNQIAIETFAMNFNPPLNIAPVGQMGGNAVHDGWMCALHDPRTEVGLTALAWGRGHFKAFIEAAGTSRDAEAFGKFFAMGMSCATRTLGGAGIPQTAEAVSAYDVSQEQISSASGPESQNLVAIEESAQDAGLFGIGITRTGADGQIERIALDEFICEHNFQPNASGRGTTCHKCGVKGPFTPKTDAPGINDDPAAVDRLIAEQEANFAAEKSEKT